MKKSILLSCLLAITILAQSQSVLRYEFTNSLNEKNGAGPALKVLGNEGIYVLDTLNEINNVTKTVYRFEQNSGFQFDNAEANNFIGDSYTIELYFLFDNLSSWKRVVDWKNRKTDAGAYVYYGKLNFYPIIYSGTAPVQPGEYTYYVITRDGTTGQVLIYTDDGVQIDFTDSNGDALIDSDHVLNFFFDDLIVPNEASSGSVALLNLYNYVLDSTTIKENFANIGGTVFSVNELHKKNNDLRIYPNPATTETSIDLSAFRDIPEITLTIQNLLGQTSFSQNVDPAKTSELKINLATFTKGIYIVRAESPFISATKKLIIK